MRLHQQVSKEDRYTHPRMVKEKEGLGGNFGETQYWIGEDEKIMRQREIIVKTQENQKRIILQNTHKRLGKHLERKYFKCHQYIKLENKFEIHSGLVIKIICTLTAIEKFLLCINFFYWNEYTWTNFCFGQKRNSSKRKRMYIDWTSFHSGKCDRTAKYNLI